MISGSSTRAFLLRMLLSLSPLGAIFRLRLVSSKSRYKPDEVTSTRSRVREASLANSSTSLAVKPQYSKFDQEINFSQLRQRHRLPERMVFASKKVIKSKHCTDA